MNKKRQKHDYTSELELKSLLIRIKNKRDDKGTQAYNNQINKYIAWHTAINNKKYKTDIPRKNIIKNKIRDKVVELSEKTQIDTNSYEKFGTIILLMISKILTKPQFSGYTYRDEFYSDAVYKIVKYLHNFDHTMISERTGQLANSFAYISQYIHNSILYVINTKKKEQEQLKKQVSTEMLKYSNLKDYQVTNSSTYHLDEDIEPVTETYELKHVEPGTLHEVMMKLPTEGFDRVTIVYPYEYKISFDEYNKIHDAMKNNMSLIKAKEPEDV